MGVANVVAQRSRCTRAQVGAVIVDARERIVATGYNNPPAGMRTEGDCTNWCPRAKGKRLCPGYTDCFSVHAEANAVAYADRDRMEGGTLYVNRSVCPQCAKLIANCGLRRIVLAPIEMDHHLNTHQVDQFLRDSGLKIHYM